MLPESFRARIMDELLPEICDYPDSPWRREGFREDWSKIHELDALDFIRGMDAEILRPLGKGAYRAPKSLASEYFFWEGSKDVSPRPLTLWIEPIITVAVLARLHLDLRWPKNLIGTQSLNWEFDVTAYPTLGSTSEFISCEVKKTISELEYLVAEMINLAANDAKESEVTSQKQLNAYRNLDGLRSRQAPFFWAVGPGGANHVFRMNYDAGKVRFEQAELDVLAYPVP